MASYTYNALSPYSIFTEPKKGSICIYPAPLALKSALGPEQIPSKVSKERLPLHFTDGKTAATIVKDPGQGYVSQSGGENGQNRKRVAGVKNKQRVNATWASSGNAGRVLREANFPDGVWELVTPASVSTNGAVASARRGCQGNNRRRRAGA